VHKHTSTHKRSSTYPYTYAYKHTHTHTHTHTHIHTNAQDVGTLLRKGVGEVVRDAARLHEQMLQMRIERGRLQREELLVREKVTFVERVNAELHELIEKWVWTLCVGRWLWVWGTAG